MIPVALSIAGSDSGGGAGIQADLKTMQTLKVWGTTAITCVTAQNLKGVTQIQPIDPIVVAEQIRTVCEGFPVKAIKTGMLYSADIIESVVSSIQGFSNIVVDPVMVATSGSLLLLPEAIEALKTKLFPLAALVTPNIPEANELLGKEISSLEEIKKAATTLYFRYKVPFLVKGGHLKGNSIDNVFYDGKVLEVITGKYYNVRFTHGTGCTLSSAITAHLALGKNLLDSIKESNKFVENAIKNFVQFSEESGGLNLTNC